MCALGVPAVSLLPGQGVASNETCPTHGPRDGDGPFSLSAREQGRRQPCFVDGGPLKHRLFLAATVCAARRLQQGEAAQDGAAALRTQAAELDRLQARFANTARPIHPHAQYLPASRGKQPHSSRKIRLTESRISTVEIAPAAASRASVVELTTQHQELEVPARVRTHDAGHYDYHHDHHGLLDEPDADVHRHSAATHTDATGGADVMPADALEHSTQAQESLALAAEHPTPRTATTTHATAHRTPPGPAPSAAGVPTIAALAATSAATSPPSAQAPPPHRSRQEEAQATEADPALTWTRTGVSPAPATESPRIPAVPVLAAGTDPVPLGTLAPARQAPSMVGSAALSADASGPLDAQALTAGRDPMSLSASRNVPNPPNAPVGQQPLRPGFFDDSVEEVRMQWHSPKCVLSASSVRPRAHTVRICSGVSRLSLPRVVPVPVPVPVPVVSP